MLLRLKNVYTVRDVWEFIDKAFLEPEFIKDAFESALEREFDDYTDAVNYFLDENGHFEAIKVLLKEMKWYWCIIPLYSTLSEEEEYLIYGYEMEV